MLPISVIMPVYNAEKTLRQAIDSVCLQTFRDFELILVNDGSTDQSPAICDAYARQDVRIKVIHSVNKGSGEARNKGLALAQGEYIAFIDSDDIYFNNLLEENYSIAKQYNADLVKFNHCSVSMQDFEFDTMIKKIYTKNEEQIVVIEKEEKVNKYSYISDKFYLVFVWDGLFKRNLLQNHQIQFDTKFEKINEDGAFCIRAFQYLKKIIVNPQIYYCYVESKTSLSKQFSSKYIKDAERLMKYEREMFDFLRFDEKKPELWFQRFSWHVLFIMGCLKNPKMMLDYEERYRVLHDFRVKYYVPNQNQLGECRAKDMKIKKRFYMWCFTHGSIKSLTGLLEIDRKIKMIGIWIKT